MYTKKLLDIFKIVLISIIIKNFGHKTDEEIAQELQEKEMQEYNDSKLAKKLQAQYDKEALKEEEENIKKAKINSLFTQWIKSIKKITDETDSFIKKMIEEKGIEFFKENFNIIKNPYVLEIEAIDYISLVIFNKNNKNYFLRYTLPNYKSVKQLNDEIDVYLEKLIKKYEICTFGEKAYLRKAITISFLVKYLNNNKKISSRAKGYFIGSDNLDKISDIVIREFKKDLGSDGYYQLMVYFLFKSNLNTIESYIKEMMKI